MESYAGCKSIHYGTNWSWYGFVHDSDYFAAALHIKPWNDVGVSAVHIHHLEVVTDLTIGNRIGCGVDHGLHGMNSRDKLSAYTS